jgi:YD repeat-containing protein
MDVIRMASRGRGVSTDVATNRSFFRSLLVAIALLFIAGMVNAQTGLGYCPFEYGVDGEQGISTQSWAYADCQEWLSSRVQGTFTEGGTASVVVPCTLYLDNTHVYDYVYCTQYHFTLQSANSYAQFCSGFRTALQSNQPAKNLGPQCHCDGQPIALTTGDPINASTGNEYRDEEDLSLGALSLHRYYNSDASMTSSHIGAHWRHSFDRTLVYQSSSPPSTATIIRPNGVQKVFRLLSTGVWTPDPDVVDTLSEQVNTSGTLTGWVYVDARTRNHENYDANGNLLSITDLNGQITTFAYSTASTPASIAPSAGLLITVTDPRGRALSFTYNAQANIATATLPDGSQLRYAYDGNGNLTAVTHPDNTVKQYVYNESTLNSGTSQPNALTGDIDETNTRFSSIGYDGQGRATQSFLPGNVDLTQVGYSSTGGGTAVTYATGAQTTLATTLISDVAHGTSLSASCGAICNQPHQSATYNPSGFPASATDFSGNVTATTYDANGLLDQQIDAQSTSAQRTTTTTWNATLRVPLTRTVANASGTIVSSTKWVYNTTGQTLARCDIDPTNSAASGYSCSNTGTVPAGVRRSIYTYCTAVDTVQCPLVGLLLTATGPRTDVTQTTTYSYYMVSSAANCGTPGAACYQAGDLRTVTDPVGHVTTIASYDADGRPTRITDANGINTDLTYTPRGWLASRSVGGALTKFTYMPYGSVQTVTDPDGVTTTYGYDTAHRLNKITDALGNTIQYTLDAAGNKTGEQVYDSTGASHKQLTRTFNTLGQLTTVVDGLGKTVFNASATGNYDANGDLVQSSDGLGIQRQMGYDALNRLVQTIDNYNGMN